MLLCANESHFINGAVIVPTASDIESIVPVSELAALRARVAATEDELARLTGLVDRLCRELDVKP